MANYVAYISQQTLIFSAFYFVIFNDQRKLLLYKRVCNHPFLQKFVLYNITDANHVQSTALYGIYFVNTRQFVILFPMGIQLLILFVDITNILFISPSCLTKFKALRLESGISDKILI